MIPVQISSFYTPNLYPDPLLLKDDPELQTLVKIRQLPWIKNSYSNEYDLPQNIYSASDVSGARMYTIVHFTEEEMEKDQQMAYSRVHRISTRTLLLCGIGGVLIGIAPLISIPTMILGGGLHLYCCFQEYNSRYGHATTKKELAKWLITNNNWKIFVNYYTPKAAEVLTTLNLEDELTGQKEKQLYNDRESGIINYFQDQRERCRATIPESEKSKMFD